MHASEFFESKVSRRVSLSLGSSRPYAPSTLPPSPSPPLRTLLPVSVHIVHQLEQTGPGWSNILPIYLLLKISFQLSVLVPVGVVGLYATTRGMHIIWLFPDSYRGRPRSMPRGNPRRRPRLAMDCHISAAIRGSVRG